MQLLTGKDYSRLYINYSGFVYVFERYRLRRFRSCYVLFDVLFHRKFYGTLIDHVDHNDHVDYQTVSWHCVLVSSFKQAIIVQQVPSNYILIHVCYYCGKVSSIKKSQVENWFFLLAFILISTLRNHRNYKKSVLNFSMASFFRDKEVTRLFTNQTYLKMIKFRKENSYKTFS